MYIEGANTKDLIPMLGSYKIQEETPGGYQGGSYNS
jgi:hypothetical protein